MKKVFMIVLGLLAIMTASLNAKAQDVTITLLPGCTWISYPNAEAMDIATALGDFVPMEGDIIKSQYSQTVYSNGRWRGRLQQFTPGLGYMYYSMRGEPTTLVFGGSTPQNQVLVTTSEPLLITAISAMGGGEVTTNDGTYIIMKGLCWATHENPMTNDDFFEESESGVGSFSISMTELNIATTYYVRAYAVTSNGTVYGDQKSFTTRDGIPEVSTDSITNILGNGATCYGTVTDNGGLNVTARGVCWSTEHNPTINDSHTTNGSGLGSYTSTMTGMNVSTTYYVRAYATTSAGIAYGEEVSFITRDGIPTLTTVSVTNITNTTATSGGIITDNGGLNIIARGVCWSTSPNPTISNSHTSNGSGIGIFSSSITGLNVSSTYYVRAYVTNNNETVYGDEVSFTTLNYPIGAVNGLFSVSSSEQVYFSKGNLQYKGSASTPYWKFAENQWDYLGNNGQGSSSSTVDRDLFGWGTSGWNNGSTYYYYPWSTGTNGNWYGPGVYTSLTGTYADWGIYNAISNGGNQPNQWRTLSEYEWEYVLYTRNTASGIRYVRAMVSGVNGVILLPDDWNNSYYSLSINTNYTSNTITASEWNILEMHGAVFLPAAGKRYGTSLNYVGSQGYYWSSTHEGSENADCFYFSSSNIGVGENSRSYGFSVRLVHYAQ